MEAHVLLSEVTKSGMRYILMQRVLERMCVFCGHTIRPRSSKDLRPWTISLGPGSLPCHPNPNFHVSKIMYQGRFYLSWKIVVQLHIKELLDPLKSATCSFLSFVWKEFFFKIELMEHVVDTYIPLKLQKFHCWGTHFWKLQQWVQHPDDEISLMNDRHTWEEPPYLMPLLCQQF
jgi:hypothetical protein